MEKFQLSLLVKIIGIGSASGLVCLDEKLYIISDNSSYLYEYHILDGRLNKIALVGNPQENSAKKDKYDFEAIAQKDEDLAIIGSGSTANRNRSFLFDTKTRKTKEKDLSELYKNIKTQLHFTDEQLNIEGFVFDKKDLYFFQRGNGDSGKNGIIRASGNLEDPKLAFTAFDLPKIKNVPAGFTDAVLVDGTIYFLATAEDTASTYLDGEVLGSMIGTINLKTMELTGSDIITDKHKFEGLALYQKTATHIEFLLCEDNDTEKLESDIYKLVLKVDQ